MSLHYSLATSVSLSFTSSFWFLYFFSDSIVLLVASKELDLEVSTEETKHMLMFLEQNAGEHHNIKMIISP
jgi:hypothetical protein